jgi:hypothetical protein
VIRRKTELDTEVHWYEMWYLKSTHRVTETSISSKLRYLTVLILIEDVLT